MEERMLIGKVRPDIYAKMLELERSVSVAGLERSLRELVKIRASQINGCAFCLDMHTKDARANGESEQRIYSLDAWEETPFFTERERAALALTEAVTLVSQTHVPDDVWSRARAEFSEDELARLVMQIVTINSWNRIAVASRTTPGTYQPAAPPAAASA